METPYFLALKANKHLVCESCNNWVDFVKSGCEKIWDEVQDDSFNFECRGYEKMKRLEVEMDRLRGFVLLLVGREDVGCASSGGIVDEQVGETVREMLERPHLSLGGG